MRPGFAESVISIIPDEQEAIEAALHMGEAGDLVLIFADALVRSWKQITKFKASGAPRADPRTAAAAPPPLSAPIAEEQWQQRRGVPNPALRRPNRLRTSASRD